MGRPALQHDSIHWRPHPTPRARLCRVLRPRRDAAHRRLLHQPRQEPGPRHRQRHLARLLLGLHVREGLRRRQRRMLSAAGIGGAARPVLVLPVLLPLPLPIWWLVPAPSSVQRTMYLLSMLACLGKRVRPKSKQACRRCTTDRPARVPLRIPWLQRGPLQRRHFRRPLPPLLPQRLGEPLLPVSQHCLASRWQQAYACDSARC